MTRSNNSSNKSLRRLSSKRRSTRGTRQSLLPPQDVSTNKKSFHITITDRIKYRLHASASEHNKTTFDLETLTLFTRHTWNLYSVSPLFLMNCSRVKLKQYAARIKQVLVKEVNDVSSNVSFNVKVSILPTVGGTESQSVKRCLKETLIEVFLLKGKNKPVLKYKGIILRWDYDDDNVNDSQSPLVLCIGASNVIHIVHRTISDMFDTVLRPIRISEEDLMWLSAILSDNSTGTTKHVSFDYSVHNSTLRNPITVSIASNIVKTIWNNIHPSETNEVTFKEVETFHKCIQSELTYLYSIKFELLKLNRIVLPDAMIGCEGKVKIHSEEALVIILSFINDIALLLQSPNPTMSVQNIP